MTLRMIILAFLACGCAGTPKIVSNVELNKTETLSDKKREPALATEKGTFSAAINVTGQLKLKGSSGTSELRTGAAQLIMTSPNPFLNPIKSHQGDKVLIITLQNQEYRFKIPNQAVSKDGKTISVSKNDTGQDAYLVIEEQKELLNSYEEEGTNSCKYRGNCTTCGPSVYGKFGCGTKFSNHCSGSQKALFKIDLFNRRLIVKIHNDHGTAEISTSDDREIKRTFLKSLSDCT